MTVVPQMHSEERSNQQIGRTNTLADTAAIGDYKKNLAMSSSQSGLQQTQHDNYNTQLIDVHNECAIT